jgi:hypothetical protein
VRLESLIHTSVNLSASLRNVSDVRSLKEHSRSSANGTEDPASSRSILRHKTDRGWEFVEVVSDLFCKFGSWHRRFCCELGSAGCGRDSETKAVMID